MVRVLKILLLDMRHYIKMVLIVQQTLVLDIVHCMVKPPLQVITTLHWDMRQVMKLLQVVETFCLVIRQVIVLLQVVSTLFLLLVILVQLMSKIQLDGDNLLLVLDPLHGSLAITPTMLVLVQMMPMLS